MVWSIAMSADEVSHMSTSTPSTPDTSHTGRRSSVGLDTIVSPVRATSFYAAVALPLAYVPMLLGGLTTVSDAGVFAVLLCVNLVALVAGHGHHPGE
jgi:hypothetical protein